jgi:hypothetical protein
LVRDNQYGNGCLTTLFLWVSVEFMQSAFSEMLMKSGSVKRGIASFFLIFALMDIVFIDLLGQQSCSEEAAILPWVGTASIEDEAVTSTSVQGPAHNQPEHPADNRPEGIPDEDCFCCCSHLIPGIRLDIAVLNGSPQPGDSTILFIPSTPPRGTFHPPRLS